MNQSVLIGLKRLFEAQYEKQCKAGPTLEELNGLADEFLAGMSGMFPMTEEDKTEFKEILANSISMTIEEGATLTEHRQKPWTAACWRTTPQYYWNGYKSLLNDYKRAPSYIQEVDKKSNEILDLCGNPQETETPWNYKGLVIGEVQSGKTALFTGVINKAADAGYKVIVILTGTIENLRQQTQERLDSDFVGRSSRPTEEKTAELSLLCRDRMELSGGICRWPVSLTSTVKDFSEHSSSARNFSLDSLKEPVLLVIKKNKSVLDQLTKWLKSKNQKSSKQQIESTLFVIDDEADNASVNTKDNDNPTTINNCIRDLLRLFRNSTYVGFTATPFANVFIDSEVPDELFPSDFITCMGIPSTYFSVYKMLKTEEEMEGAGQDDTAPFRNVLQMIPPSTEDVFSLKHKKDFVPTVLPDSLKTAIMQFMLVNAIRDLRGDVNTHRTMLINVSRFTDVQNRLRTVVDDYVYVLLRDIELFARHREWDKNAQMLRLEQTFEEDFSECGFDWDKVRNQLHDSTKEITCYAINRSTKEKPDYTLAKETGLRVIVVGGLALSRGYTLEGLCISYLYRNTAFYDTLMQMGRWFGYRAGYEDLCRVWMSETTASYYGDIARATAELKEDIRRMKELGGTPKDFGLKVRESPDSLLITCRNKMRNSSDYYTELSYNAYFFETPQILQRNFENNLKAARDLLGHLASNQAVVREKIRENDDSKVLFRNVPKEEVANFIRRFRTTPSDLHLKKFDGDEADLGVESFIRNNTIDALQSWDVAVWGKPVKEGLSLQLTQDIVVGSLERAVQDPETWTYDGVFAADKNRISGKEVEAITISKEDVAQLDAKVKEYKVESGRDFSSRVEYRNFRKHPLLVLMPVIPTEVFVDATGKRTSHPLSQTPIVTFAVSFCSYDENQVKGIKANKVHYKVNKVFMDAYKNLDDEDEDADV